MAIEFCPKCGKILQIVEKPRENIGLCSCGYIKLNLDLGSNEKVKENPLLGQGVVKENNDLEGFPHDCPKCGHNMADVTDLGAPYSDESNIYLFKCKKCKYVYRQADGSSIS